MTEFKRVIPTLLFIAFIVFLSLFITWPIGIEKETNTEALKAELSKAHVSSVDHSKFSELQQNFSSPQAVTLACLSCHNERHKEVMQSAHWNWEREEYIEGRGIVKIGKKNLMNNFCIGIGGNEQTCTKCHVGFGYSDKTFDFTHAENIDCMVCHDNSATYAKGKGLAGYPANNVDLNLVATNVGLPTKNNCGYCHFYSGGGNNVKHGDLEEALFDANRDVDVHMAVEGMNMNCVTCHEAENHKMKGKMYSVSSMNVDRATCEQCHGEFPHKEKIINEHTYKVSCQTCHIPEYAKVNATKMTWDWSTAGRLKDGEPYHEEDEDGNHTYLSIKGSFTWEKNVKPEYTWFNGTADHYIIGDDVDTSNVIKMNTLNGDYNDHESKIIPVKIHRARQIYDCQHEKIIQPKLYAKNKGEGAFWKDFNWDRAAKLGMEEIYHAYSGNYCFVRTEMYWPLNHMVSPKEKTVTCTECHTRENSRLENLDGFYMPGRDYNASVETLGIIAIVLSILGVVLHSIIRLFFHNKRKAS